MLPIIPIMKALGLMVLEKKIFKSFPIYFNVKLLTPGEGPFLTPGGFFQQYMQRTSRCCHIINIKSLGLMVSKKKIFKSFPIYFNVKTFDPWGGAIFDPRIISSRKYVEDPQMLPYTKYLSLDLVVSEKKMFKCFTYIFQCKNF